MKTKAELGANFRHALGTYVSAECSELYKTDKQAFQDRAFAVYDLFRQALEYTEESKEEKTM